MIRFLPNSIKGKISILTVSFTLIITMFMASISFYIYQSFIQKNLIQSTEFGIQLIMDGIHTDLNELIYLSKWCGSNKTITDYLEVNKEDEEYTSVLLEGFERLKEEYQNSKISDHIKRIVICDNNDNFMQIIGRAYDFYNSDPNEIKNLNFFEPLMESDKIRWVGLVEDPLVKNKPELVIPLVRPIYNSYRASTIGWAYITVSDKLITNHFKNYAIQEDSNVYITIEDSSYLLKDNTLTPTKLNYKLQKEIKGVTKNNNTKAYIVEDEQGDKTTMVTYYSGTKGWSLSQTLSKQQLYEQRNFYFMLLIVICIIIILLGTILTLYLNHIINTPIKRIRHKMKQISGGDFTADPSIEWENELGAIGKGINTLSLDMVNLLEKRISDEKKKTDLEYQILLSQINPHFLYNTLGSIKWMATIQNANGIAEMVTSLARLLKKVSKETKEVTSISDEISILEDYFLIQRYRYGGIITLDYHIESMDLYNCEILKFSLQPLIENAIFHGIEPKGEAGFISVDIRRTKDEDIVIDITDDGIGMTQEKITEIMSGECTTSSTFFKKIGIANVHNRIQYTYGSKYGLTISSEPLKYTKMTILLPYKHYNSN